MTKQKCIICDIDGTLAILGNRSPYNASKAHIVDSLNIPVAETIKLFKSNGIDIIFITGREKKFESQTTEFIYNHLGWLNETDYKLFMRENSDKRKDSIFKKEIYELHIQPKYNVLVAFEDRDQMVEMYRKELNITTFQVEYGNF